MNISREIQKLDTIMTRRILSIDEYMKIEILICQNSTVDIQFTNGERHVLPYTKYVVEAVENLIKQIK